MSISRLIIPPNMAGIQPVIEHYQVKGSYDAPTYAHIFVNGLTDTQRRQFKRMLENGIEVGRSVAETYGVPIAQFVAEVREII